MSIVVTVNGESRDVPVETTVRGLLAILDLTDSRVAVEHNRVVVQKERFSDTVLAGGDVVEIVQFVGGG